MTLQPTTGMVVCSWVRAVPAISASKTLVDESRADREKWGADALNFVQVTAPVATWSDSDTPMRFPIAQIDVWGDEGRWRRAEVLAMAIWDFMWSAAGHSGTFQTDTGYDAAMVKMTGRYTEPRRMPDPSKLVRVMLEVRFGWLPVTFVSA